MLVFADKLFANTQTQICKLLGWLETIFFVAFCFSVCYWRTVPFCFRVSVDVITLLVLTAHIGFGVYKCLQIQKLIRFCFHYEITNGHAFFLLVEHVCSMQFAVENSHIECY